jgi:hypothetical protein
MAEMGITPIMGVAVAVMIAQITFRKFFITEGILYGQGIGIRTASTSGGIEKFCGGTRTPKPGAPLTG